MDIWVIHEIYIANSSILLHKCEESRVATGVLQDSPLHARVLPGCAHICTVSSMKFSEKICAKRWMRLWIQHRERRMVQDDFPEGVWRLSSWRWGNTHVYSIQRIETGKGWSQKDKAGLEISLTDGLADVFLCGGPHALPHNTDVYYCTIFGRSLADNEFHILSTHIHLYCFTFKIEYMRRNINEGNHDLTKQL